MTGGTSRLEVHRTCASFFRRLLSSAPSFTIDTVSTTTSGNTLVTGFTGLRRSVGALSAYALTRVSSVNSRPAVKHVRCSDTPDGCERKHSDHEEISVGDPPELLEETLQAEMNMRSCVIGQRQLRTGHVPIGAHLWQERPPCEPCRPDGVALRLQPPYAV